MPTVQDVMTRDVRSVGRSDALGRVRDLVRSEHIGMVPVLEGSGEVAGVVTASDLVAGGVSRVDVADVMSTDVVTVPPDLSLTDAAQQMVDRRVHHLVVTDEGKMVGVVSSFDLIEALAARAKRAVAPASPIGMHAVVGDRIVIRGHAVGGKDRRGIITGVRGADGAPPYTVQWLDDPHDEPHSVIFFPGTDADLEHHDG